MIKHAISILAAMLALSCSAAAQSPPAEKATGSFVMPPMEEMSATRDRPLFSPQRKPDEKATVSRQETVVDEAPTAVPFDLTGVVLGEDHATAILQNRDTQETVHLKQGESADVWSVSEIGSRFVVLRNEGRQVRLQLFETRPDGSEPVARPPVEYERPRPRRPNQDQSQQRRPGGNVEQTLRRNVERERDRRRRQQMRYQN